MIMCRIISGTGSPEFPGLRAAKQLLLLLYRFINFSSLYRYMYIVCALCSDAFTLL